MESRRNTRANIGGATAAAPSAWTTKLNSYYSSITTANWMYMGLVEWSAVRASKINHDIYMVYDTGEFASCGPYGIMGFLNVSFLSFTSTLMLNMNL